MRSGVRARASCGCSATGSGTDRPATPPATSKPAATTSASPPLTRRRASQPHRDLASFAQQARFSCRSRRLRRHRTRDGLEIRANRVRTMGRGHTCSPNSRVSGSFGEAGTACPALMKTRYSGLIGHDAERPTTAPVALLARSETSDRHGTLPCFCQATGMSGLPLVPRATLIRALDLTLASRPSQ